MATLDSVGEDSKTPLTITEEQLLTGFSDKDGDELRATELKLVDQIKGH